MVGAGATAVRNVAYRDNREIGGCYTKTSQPKSIAQWRAYFDAPNLTLVLAVIEDRLTLLCYVIPYTRV